MPLIYDDFTNPESGWEISRDTYTEWVGYEDSEYHLSIKPNRMQFGAGPHIHDEFIAQVDARVISREVEGAYGLLFMFDSPWTWIGFWVCPSQGWFSLSVRQSGIWSTLPASPEHSLIGEYLKLKSRFISNGTAINRLKVKAQHQPMGFSVYVNDHLLETISFPDPATSSFMFAGKLGLGAWNLDQSGVFHVHFDNFTVDRPGGELDRPNSSQLTLEEFLSESDWLGLYEEYRTWELWLLFSGREHIDSPLADRLARLLITVADHCSFECGLTGGKKEQMDWAIEKHWETPEPSKEQLEEKAKKFTKLSASLRSEDTGGGSEETFKNIYSSTLGVLFDIFECLYDHCVILGIVDEHDEERFERRVNIYLEWLLKGYADMPEWKLTPKVVSKIHNRLIDIMCPFFEAKLKSLS